MHGTPHQNISSDNYDKMPDYFHSLTTSPNPTSNIAIGKLTPETKLQLFALVDLETCLPLSQTCRSFHDLWKSLDESLVRQKVLQRVSWLNLNESVIKLNSWNTCAKVIVSRTKTSLSTTSEWRVIDDIRAAMEPPSKENRCVPWNFMDERHQSDTPIFAMWSSLSTERLH